MACAERNIFFRTGKKASSIEMAKLKNATSAGKRTKYLSKIAFNANVSRAKHIALGYFSRSVSFALEMRTFFNKVRRAINYNQVSFVSFGGEFFVWPQLKQL